MQFLTSLLGGSGNTVLNAVLALGIVLVLVFLALWGLRAVMNTSDRVVKGGRRLALVETIPIDGRRRLVIVRRDNVEHLVLVGGAQDMVIESGIAAEQQAPRPTPARRLPLGAMPATATAIQPATAQPTGVSVRPAPMGAKPFMGRAAPPADATAPPVPTEPAPPRGPLERLRDFGRASAQRPPASLRHTGLMRQSRVDTGISPANGEEPPALPSDSATSAKTMPFGGMREDAGQAVGESGNETREDGY